MRNLKLSIEYDGTNYAGWQVQNSPKSTVRSPQKKTIQEKIEQVLHKILQEKIRLIASGRTDAGVHALGQAANFKTNSTIATEKLQRALNGLLPDDIAISKIEEVPLDFHSRYSARGKIYRYMILNQKSPSAILRDRVYFYPYPLNIRLMQQEAKCLLGRHNFKSFCASGSSAKNTVREIKKITIKRINSTLYALRPMLITIDIKANGFLYNMARNIAGTLIEIARGKLTKGSMKKILSCRDRKLAGPCAPAKGLYLLKVIY